MSRFGSRRFVLVLAAAAVCIGAAGTAYATSGKKPVVPTKLFAVVNGDGTIYRQSGVRTVSHPALGQYLVTFKRNVDKCAAVASTGGHRTGPSSSTGTPIGIASLSTFGNAVGLFTERVGAGGLIDDDRGFHLIVIC